MKHSVVQWIYLINLTRFCPLEFTLFNNATLDNKKCCISGKPINLNFLPCYKIWI